MSPLAARSMCVTGGWIREVMHPFSWCLVIPHSTSMSFHAPETVVMDGRYKIEYCILV